MSRINQINPATAAGKAKELLDAVNGKLGMVPNMTRAMANAPAVLEGYVQLNNVSGTDIDFPRAEELVVGE